MAFASSQTNDKGEEEGVQVEAIAQGGGGRPEEGTDKGTPIKYVPLSNLYSATSRCVSGSSSLIMSKKVKARKLTLLDFNNFLEKPSPIAASPPPPPPSQSLPVTPMPPPPLSAVQSTPPPSSSSTEHTSIPPVIYVYSRQYPKRNRHCLKKPSFLASSLARLANARSGDGSPNTTLLVKVKEEVQEEGDEDEMSRLKKKPRKKGSIGKSELQKLGIAASSPDQISGPRLRPSRIQNLNLEKDSEANRPNMRSGNASQSTKNGSPAKFQNNGNADIVNSAAKRWFRLKFDGVDPKKFIGLHCKLYWPLDDDWYSGHVAGYNAETGRHNVTYEDGDEENLIISNERIKFHMSRDEMQQLNLSCSSKSSDNDGLDFSEMIVMAANFDDCHEVGPGDIIWAKITGHAMWPGVIVDESILLDRKGLNKISGVKSVPVQFFGSHDFARVHTKQVVTFLKGLLSELHLKCKKQNFIQSLKEAKMYLSEQKLPKRMLRMRKGLEDDESNSASQHDEGQSYSDDDCVVVEEVHGQLEGLNSCQLKTGDLQVISIGKIVKDSDHFRDEKFIWPVGYTAVRKFLSTTDPSTCTFYKMEVLRDGDSRTRPLFRVTTDNGDQFKGPTPSVCWNKIFKKIKKVKDSSDASMGDIAFQKRFQSGSDMFGFSDPAVLKLMKGLSNSKLPLKSPLSRLTSQSQHDHPTGYRPVHVQWKDLDKCNVCHMDEEYKNNLFMQCDKCRMMVHAKCYGELEPVDGKLWLCNLCRPGAPDTPPPCCLCPVIGGAMKPTTDGRWAHLACAIWIPETCLADVKKMEPIDGLNRINKDRWKLLCSVCGVPYGACIQCSNNTCRVAYHPLCARVAGFCVELEDEDRLFLISMDEDEEEQCIRLLSFCKKHRPLSSDRLAADDRIVPKAHQYSDYTPPCNPSGCARSEPYNNFGRRGRLEPEALAAASSKRLFVENRPYLVGGFSQHEVIGDTPSSPSHASSKVTYSLEQLKTLQCDAPKSLISMVEKYTYMRDTFRKRLAFGKSGIHGFGIFAKQAHRAGDMVIEYTGELVRPPVADRREHLIYNSLVGAGTYMFRIDDERVIDATRAGSIAHLINHSCEPNCYSRVISVSGDEHIIIFAKRDIKQWEELTYDYRFFSIDEQLACYCGFPRCRGIVNDVDAEEQSAKLHIRPSELIDWRGE